jgi:hypothetical protein
VSARHLTSARKMQRWWVLLLLVVHLRGTSMLGASCCPVAVETAEGGYKGLRKRPSRSPSPTSQTPGPGNLETFHCLRSFPKQIVLATIGLRRVDLSPLLEICLLRKVTGSSQPSRHREDRRSQCFSASRLCAQEFGFLASRTLQEGGSGLNLWVPNGQRT